jgi:large subunit ribosomal protein L31e
MAEEILDEKIMVVSLAKVTSRAKTTRARVAVNHLRNFMAKHMHTEPSNIWIDSGLNERIWNRGMKHPPRKIKVKVVKWEDQHVEVSLPEE